MHLDVYSEDRRIYSSIHITVWQNEEINILFVCWLGKDQMGNFSENFGKISIERKGVLLHVLLCVIIRNFLAAIVIRV